MSLEHVRAIEALFGGGTGSRAESADHVAFIMGESVTILVIFSSESFLMVDARGDRTLFWSLGLVGEHVRFEIFERSATVRMWASCSLPAILIEAVRPRASCRPRRVGWVRLIQKRRADVALSWDSLVRLMT